MQNQWLNMHIKKSIEFKIPSGMEKFREMFEYLYES